MDNMPNLNNAPSHLLQGSTFVVLAVFYSLLFPLQPAQAKPHHKQAVLDQADSSSYQGVESAALHSDAFANYFPKRLHDALQHFQSDQFSKCQRSLKEAKEGTVESKKDTIFFLTGLCDLKGGDYQKASEYFERSLAIRHRNSEALHYLGIAQFRLHQPKRSLQSFQEALWLRDYHFLPPSETAFQLAKVFEELEDEEAALSALEDAVRTEPLHVDAALMLIRLREGRGEQQKLGQIFTRLQGALSTHSEAALSYAEFLLTKGSPADSKQARAIAETNYSSPESSPSVRKEGGRLLLRALLALDDLAQAQAISDALQKEFPEDTSIERLRMQLALQSEAKRQAETTQASSNIADPNTL